MGPSQLEDLKAAKPYLRTLLAFVLYASRPVQFSQAMAYAKADDFLSQLEDDVRVSEKKR